MGQYSEEKVIFPKISSPNLSKYGFLEVNDGLLFSFYWLKPKDETWKKFITYNFRKIAKCYYLALKFDVEKEKSRNRKLSTFLKSIWEQESVTVAMLMVEGVNYFFDDKWTDQDESSGITFITRQVLPNAGYYKVKTDQGRYVWVFDKKKNFELGIGKVFVLNYIYNSFDKNATWKYIKKNCYLKDGKWHYKNPAAKRRMVDVLYNYIKDGGIIVENVDLKFNTFIPLGFASKDASGHLRFFSDQPSIAKEASDGKSFYLKGIASTTDRDRDRERCSKHFIKRMKEQAVGLPIKWGSHYTDDPDMTLGVVVGKGGDENNFEIEAKLQSFDHNENVKKLAQKMDDGINYGFSIYGRVTKTYVEKENDKDYVVLDDGELYHILVTDQPCNPYTFAEGIFKSLENQQSESKRPIINNEKKVRHSSDLSKSEPDVVEKSTLPDQAYPMSFANNEVFKEYPHHFVAENGNLYLHKKMLFDAYTKAKEANASPVVINHLMNHLQIIGVKKSIEDLENLSNKIEELNEVEAKIGVFRKEMKDFVTKVKEVKVLPKSVSEKMNMVDDIIKEVAPRIANILNEISEEE